MAAMPKAMAQASFPHRLMEKLVRRPPPDERATPDQRERVRHALEAFLRAFAEAMTGKGSADTLERSREELLRALGESLPIATAVPLLQAFLRGAVVEVLAALRAGAKDTAFFARHASALQRARDEVLAALDGGSAPAGSFWESSI
jgi:hypothetical protein